MLSTGTNGLRVVLDTNVVLSALIFSAGRLSWVRHSWQTGHIEPLVSTPTMKELIATLAYPKFKLSSESRMELLSDYLPWCTTVNIPRLVPKFPACRDPDDVPFLELAVAGRAIYLVTGDQDLLALETAVKTRILTPEALRSELPGR